MVRESINRMHELGFKCSLDDFGSGFSSLGLLKEFDVDTIKLDRRFFLDMSKPKAEDVVECLIDLAICVSIALIRVISRSSRLFLFAYRIRTSISLQVKSCSVLSIIASPAFTKYIRKSVLCNNRDTKIQI